MADGSIVFANKTAAELLGNGFERGLNLRSVVAEPEEVDFLCRRWLRSTEPTPGSVVLSTSKSGALRCRVLGARLAVDAPGAGLVWIRITPMGQALSHFSPINEKLHQLAREVQRRQNAEEQLKKQNDVLATQKQLLESIAQGTDLKSILHALVETVQRNTKSGAVVSVLLLDADGVHLRHGAALDLPEEYTRLIDGLVIGPQAGSCGTSAFTREPVFVGDILSHPFWEPFREAAQISGMRTCWSSPIVSQDRAVLGTFALYYREPFVDVSEDAHIVELCTKTAAVAIQRARLEQQRAATEEALRKTESLAAAGRLAATVAHEINNPLEAVTNLIYLARTDPTIPEPVRALLTVADQEISRASHIAHRTVGFYRDNSLQRAVNLSDLVEDVLELYSRKLINKNMVVRKRIRPGVQVWGAEGEIRQVISNLVANAIDACDERGPLDVRVAERRSREGVAGGRVLVADQGCGILPEARSKIFDPFFTTKRDVGTGLGLWISKGIAEKHGGSLTFRTSTEAGRHGTVFSFFVPRDAAAAAARTPAQQAAKETR